METFNYELSLLLTSDFWYSIWFNIILVPYVTVGIMLTLIYIPVSIYFSKYAFIGEPKRKKRAFIELQIIFFTIILALGLEDFGLDNKWIIYFVTMIAATLFIGTTISRYILDKYGDVKPNRKISIKNDDPICPSLQEFVENNNILSDEVFNFNEKKYAYSIAQKDDKDIYIYRQLKEVPVANKDTRMYNMFLSLALFFSVLAFIAIWLDNTDGLLGKDSLLYGVLLLIGGTVIWPYIQDIKYTVRFARNPRLAFEKFISFYYNDKEVFGDIRDMNLFEVVVYNYFTKTYINVPHDKLGIYETYGEGKQFLLQYTVSKEIKKSLEEKVPIWIKELNLELPDMIGKFKSSDHTGVKLEDDNFTTESFDHGIEFIFFVCEDSLKFYMTIVKKTIDRIQRESDKEKWDLGTPDRVDLMIMEKNTLNKLEEK